jgi:cytochrome c biogenesis protein CcmG, thiol:disulfide interchange protein DsbE
MCHSHDVRKLLIALAVLAAGILVVVAAQGSEEPRTRTFDLEAARSQLSGAPAPLAQLHEQSSELLAGDVEAFRARLAELEGHPVVINKWASWCGPCRIEFPAFQEQATARGKRIAFLGLNSGDHRADAEEFLRENPVPFPSYEDADEDIARAYDIPKNFPVTLFLDAEGKTAYIHQGQYRRADELARDIERYLPDA